MPAPLTRRSVVRLLAAASAGVALSACTRGSDGSTAPTAPGGPEDPDRALRAEVGRAETELVALYAATTAGLAAAEAARLRELGSRHEAYRAAIDPDHLAEQTLSPSASGSVASAGSPSTPSTPSASASGGSATPLTPAAAVRRLTDAETRAARDRVAQAARAVDPELARLVVLAGAGAAGAARVLGGATR